MSGPSVLSRCTTLDKKKRTMLEIRGEKNAAPRVISCLIRRDQRRAKVADSRGLDFPCADCAWSSMISHVEQRSSRRESRWWFYFLSRVVVPYKEDTTPSLFITRFVGCYQLPCISSRLWRSTWKPYAEALYQWFSTMDKTKRMLGALAFGRFFGYFSFSWRNLLKKEPTQRMRFRRTNKVGNFEVKKVKSKGTVNKNVVLVAISRQSP